MTLSVAPTRSAFSWPTVIVTRSFQSGPTGSPEIARRLEFLGSSSARACHAPNAPAARTPVIRKNCLRRSLRGFNGLMAFSFPHLVDSLGPKNAELEGEASHDNSPRA